MIDRRQPLRLSSGASTTFYSLPQLEKTGVARISRLPVRLRILLESVLRSRDGRRMRDEDVEALDFLAGGICPMRSSSCSISSRKPQKRTAGET